MDGILKEAYKKIRRLLYTLTLYKNRFKIVDNGSDNNHTIHHNNHVIGHCIITIRKGNNNQIRIGHGGKFNNLKIDIDGNHNLIEIGNEVKFSGHLLIVGNHLHIKIGSKTTAIGCYILARDKSVNIGSDCMISRGIEIRTTDVPKVYDIPSNNRLNTATQDVDIGQHIWIAANVTISKNVQIADGCIIAAGSFVNKSVTTPHCMIAGTPAKVIKTEVRWER